MPFITSSSGDPGWRTGISTYRYRWAACIHIFVSHEHWTLTQVLSVWQHFHVKHDVAVPFCPAPTFPLPLHPTPLPHPPLPHTHTRLHYCTHTHTHSYRTLPTTTAPPAHTCNIPACAFPTYILHCTPTPAYCRGCAHTHHLPCFFWPLPLHRSTPTYFLTHSRWNTTPTPYFLVSAVHHRYRAAQLHIATTLLPHYPALLPVVLVPTFPTDFLLSCGGRSGLPVMGLRHRDLYTVLGDADGTF